MPEFIKIPLNHGKIALIDPEDYAVVSACRWRARKKDGLWRPYMSPPRAGGKQTGPIAMHRFLWGDDDRTDIDHRNGNPLDNRRQNLRPCTDSQNQANRHRHGNNTSGYRGVTWHRGVGKWQAQIGFNGKTYYLGLFHDPQDAARAWDMKAVELFGDFAKLNLPQERREA